MGSLPKYFDFLAFRCSQLFPNGRLLRNLANVGRRSFLDILKKRHEILMSSEQPEIKFLIVFHYGVSKRMYSQNIIETKLLILSRAFSFFVPVTITCWSLARSSEPKTVALRTIMYGISENVKFYVFVQLPTDSTIIYRSVQYLYGKLVVAWPWPARCRSCPVLNSSKELKTWNNSCLSRFHPLARDMQLLSDSTCINIATYRVVVLLFEWRIGESSRASCFANGLSIFRFRQRTQKHMLLQLKLGRPLQIALR